MKNLIIILSTFFIIGCSSTELVNNWKNPEFDTFTPSKILIVGMTSNEEARQKFEQRLKQKLESKKINAIASYEVFEKDMITNRKTQSDLIILEKKLVKEGFDSVLITKILGVEDRTAFFNRYNDDISLGFKDDYYNNQDIFFTKNYYDEYQVYHAETSLYCICIDQERTLIWKGYIDIIDPSSIKGTVKDYINSVLYILEKQRVLLTTDR